LKAKFIAVGMIIKLECSSGNKMQRHNTYFEIMIRGNFIVSNKLNAMSIQISITTFPVNIIAVQQII